MLSRDVNVTSIGQLRSPINSDVLTDEDIVAVLSFIKNSWPKQERQWQAEANGNVAGDLLPKAKGSSLLDKLLK